MKSRTTIYAFALLAASGLLCATAAQAQAPLDGQLDPGFGTGGIATVAGVPAENVTLGFAATGVEDASGLVVLGRGFRMSSSVFAAVRLTPAGTLDATYGQNGVTTIPVPFDGSVAIGVLTMDAVRRADGHIIVGAYTQRDFGTVGLFVFALDAAGHLVTNYGPGGAPGFVDFGSFADTGFVAPRTGSVELGPDGSVYVSARLASNATMPAAVGRLDANGDLDPTFGVLGKAEVRSSSYGLSFQQDGKLLLPSVENLEPGNTRSGIVRLLANGLPDLAFGTNGFAGVDFQPGLDFPVAIAVDGDRIFLGASFSGSADLCGLCVARLTGSGTLDTSFNATGDDPGIARTRLGMYDEGVDIHVGIAGGIGFAATVRFDIAAADEGDVGAFVVEPSGRGDRRFTENVLRTDLGGGSGTEDFLRYSLVDSRHRLVLLGQRIDAPAFAIAALRLDTVFRDDHED